MSTKQEEVNIEVGRKLDKLIAEMIFEVEVEELNQRGGYCIDLRAKNNEQNDPIIVMDMVGGWKLKSYSRDLEAAWTVVEKLAENGTQWRFSNKAFGNKYWWAYTEETCVQADTLPHAICLAALKHIGEQVNV